MSKTAAAKSLQSRPTLCDPTPPSNGASQRRAVPQMEYPTTLRSYLSLAPLLPCSFLFHQLSCMSRSFTPLPWAWIWGPVPAADQGTAAGGCSLLGTLGGGFFGQCLQGSWRGGGPTVRDGELCDPMDCSLPGASVHGDINLPRREFTCMPLLLMFFLSEGLSVSDETSSFHGSQS